MPLRGAYKLALKSVLTNVDLPSPDSPATSVRHVSTSIRPYSTDNGVIWEGLVTDDHDIKVEALADRLAVPLVGQIGEPDVAGQLPPHNVAGRGCLGEDVFSGRGGADAVGIRHGRGRGGQLRVRRGRRRTRGLRGRRACTRGHGQQREEWPNAEGMTGEERGEGGPGRGGDRLFS